jgi:inorganic pyrophosphatase
MQNTNYPQESAKFEIQTYKRPKDIKVLRETHVSFTGSPQRHPYDPKKVILIADPYSANTYYYEFNKDDISFLEELASIVNMAGETVTIVRIWVNKMSIAVRCTPFIVADTGKRA